MKALLQVFFSCLTTDQDDETPESSADDVLNGRSTGASPGPWFDRILGVPCLFVRYFNNANDNTTCGRRSGIVAAAST